MPTAQIASCMFSSLLASVSLVFVDSKTGKSTQVIGHVGESILEIAHKNAVDLEGGLISLVLHMS